MDSLRSKGHVISGGRWCIKLQFLFPFQCFIELGTSIPESGAELAYINYMGWYPLGFSILWLTAVFQGYFFLTNKNYGLKSQHLMKKEWAIFFSSCSAAVIFLTFGEYIMQTVNSLVCLSDSTQEWAVKLFGYGLMCEFRTGY